MGAGRGTTDPATAAEPTQGAGVTPLRVHLLAGALAGRRLRLDEPVLSIGREADNRLVIDEAHVSRHHAELRFDPERGRWTLVNLSPNGTKLGGKKVGKKPEPLRGEAEVRVGKHVLMRVAPSAGPADSDHAGDDELGEGEVNGKPAGARFSKRTKVWVGVGVYLAAMLAVVIVLAQLKGGGDEPDRPADARLSNERIGQLLEGAPDPFPNVAPSAYQRNLDKATIAYARRSNDPAMLFSAYRDYREALRNNNGVFNDSVETLKYDQVVEEVVEQVQGRYNEGFRLLSTGQYGPAVDELDRLLTLLDYRSTGNELAVNIRKLRSRAATRLED